MNEPNPYKSPKSWGQRTPEKRYEKPRDKWLGIAGILGGIALLLMTAYFFLEYSVLWIWGLGGGIGILAIGAFRLKCYFDDKRYSVLVDDLRSDESD